MPTRRFNTLKTQWRRVKSAPWRALGMAGDLGLRSSAAPALFTPCAAKIFLARSMPTYKMLPTSTSE